MAVKLGFNIDHVATLRNVREEGYPKLIKAAKVAIVAGAKQITAHLREDRRHIKDEDIYMLKEELTVDLNLEIATTPKMVEIASKVKPHSVCLVSEKREELTTEGGLNIVKLASLLIPKIERLKANNIKVVLFLDAEEEQITKALSLPIDGIEFNTGKYANFYMVNMVTTVATNNNTPNNNLVNHDSFNNQFLANEVQKIKEMANLVVSNNIEAHAGHGLNYNNITEIAKIKAIKEFNIGHFLVAEAIFSGLENSIKKMLQLINEAR